MKNRSLARFVVFALIQVVLCVLAFVFAAGISSAEPEFQTDGSIYVDGTDFTPLAQLGGEILNGAARVICGADSFGAASPASLDRLREWLAFRDLSSDKLAEPLRSSSVSHSVVTISQDGISVQQISA